MTRAFYIFINAGYCSFISRTKIVAIIPNLVINIVNRCCCTPLLDQSAHVLQVLSLSPRLNQLFRLNHLGLTPLSLHHTIVLHQSCHFLQHISLRSQPFPYLHKDNVVFHLLLVVIPKHTNTPHYMPIHNATTTLGAEAFT